MLHGRLLRYLDEVCRAGSIRKASVRLNVASSAINRRIIELEQELGTPIFERLPRGLRLTAAGEVLIQHVRETLREHDRALGRINGLKGLVRGEVSIATMNGLASNVLGDALIQFRDVHARVKLNVSVLSGERIIHALISGEADLGLAYNLPATPRLTRMAELHQRLGAVMAPDHPLAGRDSVRFSDCAAYPIVAARPGMSLRAAIELILPSNSELAPVIETDSLELMKRLVLSPPYITIVNRGDVGQEVAGGLMTFIPFAGGVGRQHVSLVHRSKGTLDPAVSTVARFIEGAMLARRALQDGS